MQIVNESRRHCARFGDLKLANVAMQKSLGKMQQWNILLPGEPRSLVPELNDFANKWGVIFPVPPKFPALLEQVFTTKTSLVHPVQISEDKNTVHLEIRVGLPKNLLLAFVDGALHHFMPHTPQWKTVSESDTFAKE